SRYLQKKSFYYYSLSDVIRDEIRARGLDPTRELLITIGNELRQRYGANILAERILAKIEDDKHYVIDSIRNPAGGDAFRAAKHFKLLRIEASPRIRLRTHFTEPREGGTHGGSQRDERHHARKAVSADRRIVASPAERDSAA